jgi:hypothetical protein
LIKRKEDRLIIFFESYGIPLKIACNSITKLNILVVYDYE